MEDDDNTKMLLPELSDMLEGRENPSAYSFFCYHFLPYVVGRTKWNYIMRTNRDIRDVASTSDEALGLVLLENSWDRWEWEHTKTKEDIKADNAKRPEERTGPQTKYTVGRGRKDVSRSCSGWTNQGILRFSELAKMTDTQKAEDTKTLKEHLENDLANEDGFGFECFFRKEVASYLAEQTGAEATAGGDGVRQQEQVVEAYIEL